MNELQLTAHDAACCVDLVDRELGSLCFRNHCGGEVPRRIVDDANLDWSFFEKALRDSSDDEAAVVARAAPPISTRRRLNGILRLLWYALA